MPVLERVSIKRVGAFDDVLVGTASAVLLVLGPILFVPVSASHLLFDGFGGEDVAALRDRAALGSLLMAIARVALARCLVGRQILVGHVRGVVLHLVRWGRDWRLRELAFVDAHAFELYVLAADVTHFVILNVFEPGKVAIVLEFDVGALHYLIFDVVLSADSLVLLTVRHLSYQRIDAERGGGL